MHESAWDLQSPLPAEVWLVKTGGLFQLLSSVLIGLFVSVPLRPGSNHTSGPKIS